MSFMDPPKSAMALSSLLSFRPSLPEPLDCTSPPVLDLSCRRSSSQSPQPEGAHLKLSPSPPLRLPALNMPLTPPLNMPLTPPLNMPLNVPLSPPVMNPMFTSLPEVDSSEEGSVQSSDHDVSLYPAQGKASKVPRPFKAYPKDPFFLAIGASSADAMLGQESTEAYAEFRRKMLSQVRSNNPPGVTNAKMRRSNFPTSTQEFSGKDPTYWEKRRKNNEAAKRSRDARRAKEDEIAIRAAFLEQENLKLKYEIAALRNETTKLRCLLYN